MMAGPHLPERSSIRDVLRDLGLAALAEIPIAGSLTSAAISTGIQARQRQQDEEFLAYLTARVGMVERRLGTAIDPEDEQFAAAARKVFRGSQETVDHAKRALLAAVLAESGSWSPLPFEERQRFLDLTIRLTPWHIRLLLFYCDPRAWLIQRGVAVQPIEQENHVGIGNLVLAHVIPNDAALYQRLVPVIEDLQTEHLLHLRLPPTTGAEALRSHTTDLGNRYLEFLPRD